MIEDEKIKEIQQNTYSGTDKFESKENILNTSKLKSIIKLLRPDHYIKNLFVFAPLFFVFKFSVDSITNTLISFATFSLIASSIYILNDLNDIEEDRLHPKKKHRPLASKKISKKMALIIMAVLSITSLTGAFIYNTNLFYVLAFYFVMNIAYTFKLKQIPIVDVFIVAAGFVMRLMAGAVVTDITLSKWIVIITFLLAVFLALAKRRDDVILSSESNLMRKSIGGYNLEFINASMILMSGIVIISYILYTVSPDVLERLNTQYLYLTAFFVILGILRYMQITFVEQKSGNPTKLVLKDRFLQLTIFSWLVSFELIINFLVG
ncbi:MAG: decaprenyl-phosphate phosphoribosyltransferase [Ichthyobacteriaceae bacterium]|nr:decaprenyl-phosphate phosphoribosyltransferase [Ichthyobacteriaceae bacterium]